MSTSKSANELLNGRQITLARQRRNLTKTALANRLEVTLRTISRYETEGAPAQQASNLASALDFPISYFIREPITEIHLPSVQFRAARKSTKAEQNAAVACGQFGAEIDDWILSRFKLPAFDLPDFEGMEPSIAAAELRYQWALGIKPLPNLIQLLESHGVHTYGLPPAAESVDAFSTWHKGRPLIFVAQLKTPERTRFDVAHELGHLVLHRDGTNKDEVEREKEADIFASHFLMPTPAIHEVPYNPSFATLLSFKTAFKVSAMAAAKRLMDSRRISEWNYRNLMIKLSRSGFRTSEPGGMLQRESSRIFTSILSRDFPRRTSVIEIANSLGFPPIDVYWLLLQSGIQPVVSQVVPAPPVSKIKSSPKLKAV